MRMSSEAESTDLPFVAEGSKRPHTTKSTVCHMFIHISPKIYIVKFVS